MQVRPMRPATPWGSSSLLLGASLGAAALGAMHTKNGDIGAPGVSELPLLPAVQMGGGS